MESKFVRNEKKKFVGKCENEKIVRNESKNKKKFVGNEKMILF
jgi:hypothetical protein